MQKIGIRYLLAGAAIVALLVVPLPVLGQAPTPTPTPAATPPPAPAPAPAPAPDRPVRIVDIVVRGAEHVPLEVVYGAIGSRVGEFLDRDRVRQDVEQILALGLFADVVVRIQATPDAVQIIFIVVENPVVLRVQIVGNTVISTDEIRRVLGVAEGRVLNTVDLRAGARNVERLYHDRGYILVRIADVEFTPDGTLRVVIREGVLESIELRGLARTRPLLVQRMLTVRQGEVFNIHRVNRDLHEVFHTGLFENVRAVPRPGSEPDTVALAVEFEERQSREIGFGVGFSPEQGFLGNLQFTERNLHGMGRTITLSYNRNVGGLIGDVGVSPVTGLAAENIVIQYRDPWFLERGQSIAIEIRDTSQLVDDTALGVRYRQMMEGGSAVLTRRFGNALSGSIALRTERTAFTMLAGDETKVQLSRGLTNALRVETSYDLRDDPRNPRQGFRATASVESAFRFFGGDFDFMKYHAEYAHFLPLWEGTVAGRVRVAASSGFLPIQEQFALGGPHSLRGLPGGALRGNSTVLATVEYRLPLVTVFPDLRDITAVVFADAGGVSRAGFGFVDTFQFAYGIGVLVNTPIGPIRIDHAIGPNGRTQTWLYFGHPF